MTFVRSINIHVIHRLIALPRRNSKDLSIDRRFSIETTFSSAWTIPSPGKAWTVTRSAHWLILNKPFVYCETTVWPISANFLLNYWEIIFILFVDCHFYRSSKRRKFSFRQIDFNFWIFSIEKSSRMSQWIFSMQIFDPTCFDNWNKERRAVRHMNAQQKKSIILRWFHRDLSNQPTDKDYSFFPWWSHEDDDESARHSSAVVVQRSAELIVSDFLE